jgi:thiamine biosynthesis lipoprotein
MQFSTWGMSGTLTTEDPGLELFARETLWEWVARVDDVANRFRSDSELTRLNHHAGRGPLAVSPLLLDLVTRALDVAHATDELCDPTVLPALIALGYDDDIETVRQRTNYDATPVRPVGAHAVHVDYVASTIELPAGAGLDLGAIAKAFTVDAVADALADEGGVVVEIGGDIAVRGSSGTGPWVIGIADSLTITGAEPRIAVTDCGVATSSTRGRHWRAGEREVHHIIDPATGLPAVSPYCNVTVAASDCVRANALATSSFLRGEDAGYFIAQWGATARLVRSTGEIEYVGGWPEDEKVEA